ncbi:MAG: EAL domain-containing protein [bacterium]|nr:EAL domain-containing protein [bacterium]
MNKKTNILIVDDEIEVLEALENILTIGGYGITKALNGKEALENIREKIPHLLILDLLMPMMSGYEVCQKIRKDPTAKHLPIIMLTGKGELENKIEGLRAGIDDYMVKPFEPKELLAKIEAIIHRTYFGLDANPLTSLPGNNSIQEEIKNCISSRRAFAVCYFDIDDFKTFNDRYGFERGDEVIRKTSQIIIEVIRDLGDEDDFIGHIGGDDFIVIIDPKMVESACSRIIKEFDQMVPYLYNEEDRKRGYIVGNNRQGYVERFPLMSVSIGVVTNEKRKITHLAQVSKISADLKKYIKRFSGSNYIVDRREADKKEVISEIMKPKDLIEQEIRKRDTEKRCVDLFRDEITGLLSLPQAINDIKDILVKKGQIGLLCLSIKKHQLREDIYGWQECEEILRRTSKVLFKLQANIFRKEDIISTYGPKRSNIVISLIPPRYKESLKIEDLEKVSSRVQEDLRLKINKEIGSYVNQKFGFYMGYALITNIPEISIGKLVYQGIEKALRVASNREQYERWRKSSQLKQIIKNKEICTLFQPIFNFQNKEIFGYEALSRGFSGTELENPEVLFDLSKEIDSIWELECICKEKALSYASKLKPEQKLFLNIEPQVIEDPRFNFQELVNKKSPNLSNVVLEIPEQTIAKNFRLLHCAISVLKKQGINTCIDNFRLIYPSFQFIVKLKPDFVKLDISLARNIDKDSVRQKLLLAIIESLKEINTSVIASGIENKNEYNTLLKMGINYGQGYFFSKQGEKLLSGL